MTASSPHGSGYACYFDQERYAYLASEFSAAWTQYSDAADFKRDTVRDQYTSVKQHVQNSHPQVYGDLMVVMDEPLGTWQSYRQAVRGNNAEIEITDRISERDANEEALRRQWEAGKIPMDTYYNYKSEQIRNDYLHAQLVQKLYPENAVVGEIDFACYKSAIQGVEKACGQTPQDSLDNLSGIADLCKAGIPAELIVKTAQSLC
eukprot:gnl/Trimastix_PCT/691.p1 GENE.gnl/Trimastix_PCT/691~~gnl/Trimastix_PCT/691.p1  ORF type:complete len:205 (+),score=76.19 gnl/Trimastix_PCT/691:2-616(+)